MLIKSDLGSNLLFPLLFTKWKEEKREEEI